MPDSIFERHLENMRALQEILKEDISKGFKILDLDDVLRNPEAELQLFSSELSREIIKKYSTRFIAEGVRFADEMATIKRKVKVIEDDDRDQDYVDEDEEIADEDLENSEK